MKVKEIMAKDVAWLPADATVQEAAQKMRDHNVGSLPIRQGEGDGALAGMITDRDIACRFAAKGGDSARAKVADFMSTSVVSCSEDDDVIEAAHLMETKQLHRLPVQNREKQLVGIISLADIATHVPHELSGEVVEALSKSRPLMSVVR